MVKFLNFALPLAAATAVMGSSHAHLAQKLQRGLDASPTEAIHRPWQSDASTSAWNVPTKAAAVGVTEKKYATTTLGNGRIAIASSSTTIAKPASTSISTGAATSIVLTSNTPGYGYKQVRADLKKIMAWAFDTGNLGSARFTETAAAVMSAAARYYPEIPTIAACRVILADIRAESDFVADAFNAGRLDSGPSIGLMQVSPAGGSQELPLWKTHARVSLNTYSWNLKLTPNRGKLIDWATGKQMVLGTLNETDLFRPWVNIHLATWIQSNSARTSSQDPYDWMEINARTLAGAPPAELAMLLQGAGLPRSMKTGLGSWVAGAAQNGEGSYMQVGDDISAQYFDAILAGVSVLYNETKSIDWLDSLIMNGGLVDYR